MLREFTQSVFTSLDLQSFLSNLLMALICGILISLFYRATYRGPHYSPSFVQALIVLAMVTSLVIMVIGNNLARAFGLVGAMSIIRFRTAVKDTQDIVFIFFSLASGMAAGVGLKTLAFAGTLLIGSVLLGLSRFDYARPTKREFLVQFFCTLTGNQNPYLPVMEKHCKKHKLVNMQSHVEENQFEISFHVQLKDVTAGNEFIRELSNLPEVWQVRFFFDEEPA